MSAAHFPKHGLGGPKGVHIQNEIWVGIRFDQPVDLRCATSSLAKILEFFQLIAGRPQKILGCKLLLCGVSQPTVVDLHWSMPPYRNRPGDSESPHPSDVLLGNFIDSDEMSSVISSWIDCSDEVRNGRSRFFSSFSLCNKHSVGRLIDSATAFEFFKLPKKINSSSEVNSPFKAAIDECLGVLKGVPVCPEKARVIKYLNGVARAGRKASLKDKAISRAEIVVPLLGGRLPFLTEVVEEAVFCRNYYIHGERAHFDYDENPGAVSFMTSTLEFVFAAADLVLCGWDISKWLSRGTSMTHPFGCYIVTDRENLLSLGQLCGGKFMVDGC